MSNGDSEKHTMCVRGGGERTNERDNKREREREETRGGETMTLRDGAGGATENK